MSRPRVLLIEDEPALVRGVSDLLAAHGLDVRVATDGHTGLDAALAADADVVLLDLMLPGVNGYEICRAVRRHGLDVPVLMLTAKGQEEDVVLGLNLGADDYLTKPVAKADLLNAIRTRLQRAAQQARPEFNPDFSSAKPLEKALDLTPRVAETLLWIAQGKTNGDIAAILGISEATVKKHVLEIFQALSVETRTAASLRALEVLSSPAAKRS